jgi:hypothetical protein
MDMHRLVDTANEVIMEDVEEVVKGHVASKGKELSGKEAILEILSRAADEPKFLRSMADDPHEALNAYYTLTAEEKAALASGDIKKIENWVGKLDERLSTWLWCRLSQEKW